LGGGCAGLTAAKILDPMGRFEVFLIDTKDFFEFTPSTVHGMVDPGSTQEWRIPFKNIVHQGNFLSGSVDLVGQNFVAVSKTEIPFDYLIISTGSSYTSQIKASSCSASHRSKKLELEYMSIQKSQRIVVVGGGNFHHHHLPPPSFFH